MISVVWFFLIRCSEKEVDSKKNWLFFKADRK